MSYISSLNLLNDDGPIPLSEEDVTDELALWANASFKFDNPPGCALLDDPLKQSAVTSSTNDNNNAIYGILNGFNHFDHTHSHHNPSMMTILQQSNMVSPTTEMYSSSVSTPTTPTFNMNPAGTIASDPSPSALFAQMDDEDEDYVSRNKKDISSKDKSNDEEKRRRNTAASARFRMKKKQREQALQQTVQEMTEKTEQLEKRCKELELEAKWLRALLIEKNPALVAPLSSVASSSSS